MNLNELAERFSSSPEDQQKAIFSTLFIAANKLHTLFDSRIPELSLKQFMLLSLVRQADPPQTFTQLGGLLGCSRQNVKKLAGVLAKKGFVTLRQNPTDPRAVCILLTEKARRYFQEDFARYQVELKHLFEVYSQEEIETLFRLLTRLYTGIERLEKLTTDKGEQAK